MLTSMMVHVKNVNMTAQQQYSTPSIMLMKPHDFKATCCGQQTHSKFFFYNLKPLADIIEIV